MFKPSLTLFAVSMAVATATAAPAFAGDGKELLKFAPESSQMVMVLDMADARDSALLQKGFAKLLEAQPDAKTKLAELGVDPMKDIDTLLFAGGGATDMQVDSLKSMMIVVEGRLPKDKLANAPGAVKSTYQTIDIYTNRDTDAAFIGDRLFFAKKGTIKPVIDLVLNKGKGKGKSVAASKKAKALRDAIAGTDTSADLWVTILVPAKGQKQLQSMIAATTVSAHFDFSADVALGLTFGSRTADDASKNVAALQALLPQATSTMNQLGLTKAAKSLTVTQAATFVKVAIKMTEAEILSLAKTAQAMSGMGAGGP